MGEMIEYAANGGTARGYLTRPDADKANGKGIIVIQEWWGLVPHIKDIAERFAALGYVALAPDLWDGKQATAPDEAMRLFMALNLEDADKTLRGAAAALHAHGAEGKLGIIGFCMGGQLALHAGCANADEIAAVVDFYGIHPKVSCDFAKLEAPVLAIFGADDGMINAEAVAELKEDLLKAGKEVETIVYEGAGHAFFNDARPEAYNAAAAEAAWGRVKEFFAGKLLD